MGKQWKQCQTLFWGAPKSLQMVTAAMKLKVASWKKSYDQPKQHSQKQRHYFVHKGPSSQGYGFSSMDVKVGLWRRLSAEESMPLNCGVGEDSWESLGLQGDPTSQSWIFIARTDAEAETLILWSPYAMNWLIGKDPDSILGRLKAGWEGEDRGWYS